MATQRPVAVLVGTPAWADDAARVLADAGLQTLPLNDPATYIDDLIAIHPALILVDAAAPDWAWWVTTPKVRQETRRIPLIVVSADPAREPAALGAGADRFLPADFLADTLPGAIEALARLPDAAQQETLACQCAEPMPPLGLQGIERFNAGDYYGQHDLFEMLWMAELGPVRDLYRAILQVGVAYHHIRQGNPRGALKMLRRSAQWFAHLPDVCQGVDVRRLREDASSVEAMLRALSEADLAAFDPDRWPPLPPLHTVSDPPG